MISGHDPARPPIRLLRPAIRAVPGRAWKGLDPDRRLALVEGMMAGAGLAG